MRWSIAGLSLLSIIAVVVPAQAQSGRPVRDLVLRSPGYEQYQAERAKKQAEERAKKLAELQAKLKDIEARTKAETEATPLPEPYPTDQPK
jgi:hypothetical protein